MGCNIEIQYIVDGEEKVGGIIPTNLNSYDEVNAVSLSEAISGLDIDSLNTLLSTLSDLNLLSTKVVYSNGEPLIGNATINDIRSLVSYVPNKSLQEDFLLLINKLIDMNAINPSQPNILLLDEDIESLNIDGNVDVRGTLLNNEFIILKTNGTFNEATLRDLYHELLHLYYSKINKSDPNFERINEIAYNIYTTAKQNQDKDPYIKEFVNKVSKGSSYDLNEFIAYLVSEPKYRDVLNINNSDLFNEFIGRLFSMDINPFIQGSNQELEIINPLNNRYPLVGTKYYNHSTHKEEIWDGNVSKINKNYFFYFSRENNRWEYDNVPFVGKNDSYYIELEIPKSKNVSYQQISEIIWKNYESTVLDSEGNPKKDLYNLNYSEPVKLTTEAQLYSLVPGDLLLIPNFSRDKNIIYGKFDDDYFSYAKYHPIQSVWKNRNGETFITLVNKYGSNVGHFTISYTDLVKLSLEKNKQIVFRKLYGALKDPNLPEDLIKNIRDTYERNIESEDYNNQPLIKSIGFDRKGLSFKYYTVGKSGFKLDVSNGTNATITQELRQNDIIKLRSWNKEDENSEWDSFTYYAPVVRTIGTIVEVALKNKDGKYFTKKIPFRNIETVIFTKENHPDLDNIYNQFINDYDTYSLNTKDKSKYQSIWFNLNILKSDQQPYRKLEGDFSDNLDRESVIKYRRDKVRSLRIGDSVSIEWDLKRTDGSPVISKHIVVGISGDRIYFLNRTTNDSAPKIGFVDLKTEFPLSENSKGQRINIPSLSAIHYNNTSDLELVEDLNTKKENASKAFTRVDDKIVFDPNSNYIPLKDLYYIINIDSSNAEQETAKLQRGDIIRFKENDITFIGVVSNYDPITGTIIVPGSYRSGYLKGRSFRKIVSPQQLEYIGFAINPNYELGIIGHKEISEYNKKRLSRLYDLNHSTYGYSLEEILKKKSLLNKSQDWVIEQEAVYVIPKNITEREFKERYQDSKKKTLPHGRVTLLTPTILDMIKNRELIDLTSEYIKANNVKDTKIYGLKNIRTGIQVNDSTGFYYDPRIYQRSPEQVINIIEVNDVVKIKYNDKFTKYLRIKSITDKGINLESEIVGLNGEIYNNSWYINFNDIKSGKYLISELYYPINKTRQKELENLSITDEIPQIKKVEYFTDTYDKFDKKKILNRVIENINSTYNNIINVIDDAKIQELVDSENLNSTLADSFSRAGAFIWNGKIYVNINRADISSPLHELMHLIMGALRSKNYSLYSSLLDKVATLPEFNERFRNILTNRTLNDAKEEAFVEFIADSLSGVFSSEEFNINNLLSSTDFFGEYLKVLDSTLSLDLNTLPEKTSETLSRELSKMPIEKIITEFNSLLLSAGNKRFSLFNPENVSEAFKNRNITNIKSSLLNSKNPNTQLLEKC